MITLARDLHRKGWLTILSFFLPLCSCTTAPSRQWELEKACTPYASYDSARLFLPVDDQYRGLELVLVHGSQGASMYLNACNSMLPCDPCEGADFDMTPVDLVIADQYVTLMAHRLKGGQRLLLPTEAVNLIVESLFAGCPVFLTVGCYQTEITPCNFPELYYQLGELRHND